MPSTAALDVWLERGSSRTFAIAPAWPGWARSARTRDGDDAAVEALLSYADRYAEVARRAGAAFDVSALTGAVTVVGSVTGTTTTDFGATDVLLPTDAPGHDDDMPRLVSLARAAWSLLDDVVDAAPAELAKGPRGGGRDTAAVVAHVVEAERAYVRKIDVRHPPFDVADRAVRDAMRADVVDAWLRDDPGTPWSARYALRRGTWHVLDHAWEIQDRS